LPPAHFPLAATTLDEGSGRALQFTDEGFVLSVKKPVLVVAAVVPKGPPVKLLGLDVYSLIVLLYHNI
jgi:hypothetical protein